MLGVPIRVASFVMHDVPKQWASAAECYRSIISTGRKLYKINPSTDTVCRNWVYIFLYLYIPHFS